MKGNVLCKEGIEIDNDLLPQILIEFQLTDLSFVTVGVTKFVLTKLGIIIDGIEPVSAIEINRIVSLFSGYTKAEVARRSCLAQTRGYQFDEFAGEFA